MSLVTERMSYGTSRERTAGRMAYPVEFAFSPAALPMLIAAVAIFLLGIFVLGRERASLVSHSFLGITLTVSLWLTATAAAEAVRAPSTAFLFSRIAYLGIPLIPAAVLQFTAALLGISRRLRWWLAATWACGIGFASLFATTRLLLSGTWHYRWGYYPRLTPYSATFLLFFAVVLGASLMLLSRAPAQTAQERRRNHAFLVALAIGYAGSIDYLPAFGVPLFPVGCAAIVGFIVLSARSIMRLRLRDLSPSSIADQLLQTMHGGAIVVDMRGQVQIVNDVAAQLLGWPRSTVRHADLRTLLGVGVLPMTDTESFCRRLETRNRVAQWKRSDGSRIELSVSARAIRDQEEEIVGVLYVIEDVSDRRRAEENEFGAMHDALTTLPNRVLFAKSFEEEKAKIVANGRVPTVLFLDLDGFKAVNDEHGHETGDELLRLVAKRIRNSIRGTDLLARYGGDEFVLLLDLARATDAQLVGAKLVRVVGESYSVDDRRLTVGASIGAAFYPEDGRSCEELIRTADAAMYAAKRAGKGRLAIRADVPPAPIFKIDASA